MPTAVAPKLTALREVTFSESALKVDRENGVIHGVKILGKESKNGRVYSASAIEQAAKAYEGLGVNVNHPDKREHDVDRPVQDGYGWLESVEVKSDGVYGDLHYLKAHQQADVIAEAAERNPRRFGLSHNAEGRMVRKDGRNVVESIERMHSVDIVQSPATNQGLFESEHTMTKTIRECLTGTKFAKLLEDEAMGPMAEMPVEMPDESAPEDQIKAAFRTAVMAAFDDDSLDTVGTLARIKTVLKAYDALKAADEKPAEAPAESGADEAAESLKRKADPMFKKLQEQVETLTKERDEVRTREACRTLLESKNRDVSPVRLESLAALPEAKRQALVESWPEKVKETPKPGRPATSAPIRESTIVTPEKITDGKSFAEAILAH